MMEPTRIEVTTTLRQPRWKRWAASVTSLAWRLVPSVRRRTAILDRCGRVYDLRSEGKSREAFALAMRTIPDCLEGNRGLPESKRTCFWLLLTHAAQLAESVEDQLQVLESLSRADAPGAWREAAVLEEISRWPWRRGDATHAIQIARDAVRADPAWPWAHVTLAFYLQQAKLGDPLPELTEAVRADPGCLPEIEKQFGRELASSSQPH